MLVPDSAREISLSGIYIYSAVDIDACRSYPCMYGGECSDDVNKYTCKCTAVYTGVNCETCESELRRTSVNKNIAVLS